MRALTIWAALNLLAAGCTNNATAPTDGGLYTSGDGGFTAIVEGYVWDPEIYWYGFATCPLVNGQCPLPPVVIPGTPLLASASIANALVGLFDPTQPTQLMPLPYMAVSVSRMDGGYDIENVPLRNDPPFFAVAISPLGIGGVDGGLPATAYFPTLTGKPIATGGVSACLSQSTGIVSDSGVAEAVAKYLTVTGTPTTIADLSDPTKVGGLVVFWLWAAGSPSVRVPAFGAFVTADVGKSIQVSWLPPGMGPPSLQSTRGFFVSMDPPTPNGPPAPGVTVVVLPPTTAGTSPLNVTLTDPIIDTTAGRPFTFPTLPQLTIPSGIATFLDLQAIAPGSVPAPDWVCLPPS